MSYHDDNVHNDSDAGSMNYARFCAGADFPERPVPEFRLSRETSQANIVLQSPLANHPVDLPILEIPIPSSLRHYSVGCHRAAPLRSVGEVLKSHRDASQTFVVIAKRVDMLVHDLETSGDTSDRSA